MQITREFLVSEVARLEADREQAKSFVTAVQGAIDGYKALVERLDAPKAPEPTGEEHAV